jgi:hypothetical protein
MHVKISDTVKERPAKKWIMDDNASGENGD